MLPMTGLGRNAILSGDCIPRVHCWREVSIENISFVKSDRIGSIPKQYVMEETI